eukprot:1152903-Pelagomonas_calceolata.AAC.3
MKPNLFKFEGNFVLVVAWVVVVVVVLNASINSHASGSATALGALTYLTPRCLRCPPLHDAGVNMMNLKSSEFEVLEFEVLCTMQVGTLEAINARQTPPSPRAEDGLPKVRASQSRN